MTAPDPEPTSYAERVLHVELARPVDMFETPAVTLGSTVGGFTPGIERCRTELAGHSDRRPLRLEIAVPPEALEPGLAEKMAVSLRHFCTEQMRLNSGGRSSTIRSGLRAFRIGLPVTLVGLAITAGATKIGDIDDALRAVIDIIGWTLAWVGLWYPFDKILFYPLDYLRENRALAALRDAEVTVVAIDERARARSGG